MSIEVATYIADLQPVNPPSTDPRSQGDDHIRLIKQVLQNQFTGASRALQIPGIVSLSISSTLTKLQGESTVYVNTSGGPVTLTTPSLTAADAGWRIFICKTSSDVNPIFVVPSSGALSSGGYTVTRARRCIPGRRFGLIWDGLNWFLERAGGLPIGALIDFWGTTLPAGFEWPNGQTLSTVATNYPEYNAVYGSGATPDLRGYAGVTLDNLGGTAAGRLPNGIISGSTLGAVGGVDAAAITAAQMPSHYHTASVADPTHTHNFNQSGGLGVNSYVYTNTAPQYFYYQGGGQGAQQYPTYIQGAGTGVYLTSSNGTNTTNSAGSGSIMGRMQPSIMLGKLLVVE